MKDLRKQLLNMEVVSLRRYQSTVRRKNSWASQHRTECRSCIALQGILQGYTFTGRTGLFPSYEAFLGTWFSVVMARIAGAEEFPP